MFGRKMVRAIGRACHSNPQKAVCWKLLWGAGISEQTVKQFDQITVAGTGFKRSRELQKEKRQHSGVVLINSVPISIG